MVLQNKKISNSGLEFNHLDDNLECTPGFLTGVPIRTNFKERRFWIELLDGCVLEVPYDEAENAESVLVSNRNGPVQIHGSVTYNEHDKALSISNVDKVLPIDTSSIEVAELMLDGSNYRARPPLQFVVEFNNEEYFYSLEGDLDIILAAESRIELEDALDNMLNYLWTKFVHGNPDSFADDAKQLRNELLGRIDEIQRS